MTDRAGVDTATTSSASAEQLERIAQIRQRRAEAAPDRLGSEDERAPTAGVSTDGPVKNGSRRRRHVAQGSRVLAAGLGATTMFGIVTVLGLDNPVNGAENTALTTPVEQPLTALPVVVSSRPVQVVIHRVPAVVDPPPVAESALPVTISEQATETPAPTPVQLTANPVVQTITVAAPAQPRSRAAPAPAAQAAPAPAPAPAATTSGSD